MNALYEGRELILDAFRSAIFSMKQKQGKGLKILTPKQNLQDHNKLEYFALLLGNKNNKIKEKD